MAGEGALEAQQSAAARIPYENIAAADATMNNAMNAFMTAQRVNVQRQELEKQLMAINANMTMRNQEFALDQQKFGWQQQYQMQALNRQSEAEKSLADYRNTQSALDTKKLNWQIQQAGQVGESGQALTDDLSSLSQDESTPIGSAGWWNKAWAIKTQHPYNKETANVWKQFSTDARRQSLEQNQSANMTMRSLQTSMSHGVSPGSAPFTIGDLQRPAEDWQTSADGKNKFIADIWQANPDDPTKGGFVTLNAKQVKERADAGEGAKIRYRSTPASNLKNWMDTYKTVQKFGSGNISDQPADASVTAPGGRVRVKDPNGNSGTLPASQVEAAVAAGWTTE